MKIHTKYHGELEIDTTNIIHFEHGIPGFIEEQKFTILPFSDDGTFFIMQSVQTPGLAFVIASPFDFFSDYKVKLSDPMLDALQVDSQDDIVVFVILNIQEPYHNTTANLQGPVVINDHKKLGKQVIIADSAYETKHYIVKQPTSTGQEG